MAKRKRKEHRITGDGVSTKDTRKRKQSNHVDSAGTDGAIEGESPAENSTNTASHATRVAKKAKQKQIAATKQAETALFLQHLPRYYQLHDLLVRQLS